MLFFKENPAKSSKAPSLLSILQKGCCFASSFTSAQPGARRAPRFLGLRATDPNFAANVGDPWEPEKGVKLTVYSVYLIVVSRQFLYVIGWVFFIIVVCLPSQIFPCLGVQVDSRLCSRKEINRLAH